MKAMFIAFNQAYNEEIIEILESHGQRGYTLWTDIQGRGSEEGIPHRGSHAWPELNYGVLAVVPDTIIERVLAKLKETDEATPDLGLRAFVWNIETYY